MDLTAVLVNAMSGDQALQKPAEAHLQALEQSDLATFLVAVCTELGNPDKPAPARQLAGLLLKNAIFSKDEAKQKDLSQRWLIVADDTRRRIKADVLNTLASPVRESRSTAALVVGKIAAIEMPYNMWPELVELLLHNIQVAPNADLKQSTFEALGYVCEECADHLSSKSGSILQAIAHGMDENEKEPQVKFAATVALSNALHFIRDNMQQEGDRDTIMKMIFSTAVSAHAQTRVASFQCLCELAELYYPLLENFMNDLFNLTAAAIQSDTEEVGVQAIEFWSTICDVELEMMTQAEEADAKGVSVEGKSSEYAKRALFGLLPIILQSLLLQNEDPDDETWGKAASAAACLGLLAQTTRDDVLSANSPVLKFVQDNMTGADWRQREAATIAFGSILDGPSEEHVQSLVSQAFLIILNLIKDDHPAVKDTAAWTIGRICDLCPETITPDLLQALMQAFEFGLQDEPKIASSICWAIHNLAEAVVLDEDDTTSLMSPYFAGLVSALLATSDRADATQGNLLTSAYETLYVLIKNAAPDSFPIVHQQVPVLLDRFKKTFGMAIGSSEAAQKQFQLQGLICGSLNAAIHHMKPEMLTPVSDELMLMLLEVLKSNTSSVHEEALFVVSAIAQVLGEGFLKYMHAFQVHLLSALKSTQESRVCSVAVGVVSDLSRILGRQLAPICDDVVNILLTNLQNSSINREVKPIIISCLGDLALALGGDFERYLQFVMMMLHSASSTRFDNMNWDNIDYLNSLRDNILEAYVGIVHGLAGDQKSFLFTQFVEPILQFLTIVVEDKHTDRSVITTAIGLIGDLASNLGKAIQPKFEAYKSMLHKLIEKGLANPDSKDDATWTLEQVQSVYA